MAKKIFDAQQNEATGNWEAYDRWGFLVPVVGGWFLFLLLDWPIFK